jgi:hypothetical protein
MRCAGWFLEPQIDDLAVEIAAQQMLRLGQFLRVRATEITVDDALVIADQPFDILRQTHELKTLRVHTLLLDGDVGIILLRDGRELLAVRSAPSPQGAPHGR